MDHELRDLLDQQDWEAIVEKLTLAALHELKVCGLHADRDGHRLNPSANDASGYALDAMVKVFEGCDTGENKWDPSRGALYPFLDRLVRRLVTDDKRKYTERPSNVSPSEDDPEPEFSPRSQDLLSQAFDLADEETQEFILALIDAVDKNGSISWIGVMRTLGITRHGFEKHRQTLSELLLRCQS